MATKLNEEKYNKLSLLADENAASGKDNEARKLLNEGLTLAKENKDLAYIEFFAGELEHLDGKDEMALTYHLKSVELDPHNPFLLRNLGVNKAYLGKHLEAIEMYNRAMEIKPDDYASMRGKGSSLRELGELKEAIGWFDGALKIKPSDYHSLREKGDAIGRLGDELKAIELYDQALNIKPDDYILLHNKGVALGKLGKEIEAIRWFDRALEIKKSEYNSLRSKGVALGKLGKEMEALEYFDRALKIKEDDYKSLRNKGVTLSRLGKEKEAIDLYDHALKINPEDWYVLANKAIALEKIGRGNDAVIIYNKLQSNIEKIREKEIVDFIKFKIGIQKISKTRQPEVVIKGENVLNKVVNAFESKKESFFKSVDAIEDNFKKFIDTQRSIPQDFPSFISVLRKWNSYTPILPSETGDNKGGGYFLFHKGKGIVIDPGFNFIENFYHEGFKVADIDAVLISHAHNDHTVDLESILTLVYKHNDAIKDAASAKKNGKSEIQIKEDIENAIKKEGKKVDLFLNLGTFMKYSGWLDLKDSNEINSVTVLQPNTTYNLPGTYNGIVIHTTRAKHHEVIDNKYAIGFILDIEGDKIGFTGDTGWDYENNGSIVEPFLAHKPKLIVAHLGSVKKKELEYVHAKNDEERNNCFYSHHLGLLGITYFLDKTKPKLTIISEFGEELREYRKEIAEVINQVLDLNCLPGDIGLHIRIKDLGIYCFIDEKFIDYKKIKVYSKQGDSDLAFSREELDNGKFNTALDKKKLRRAVPLSQRIKDLS